MLVGYFSDTFAYVFCCSFIYLLIHLPVYTYLFIYLPVYPLTCLIHLLSLLNLLVCLIK